MTHRMSRRRLAEVVGVAVASRPALETTAATTPVVPAPDVVVSVTPADTDVHFDPSEFGIVGVYDVDWLAHPDFALLLDNMAASPRAFRGVRFFGAFTTGTPEEFLPETGGNIWTEVNEPIDFRPTFDALEALTSLGLIPFISLGFFPPAVSGSPIQPPAGWEHWKHLVRTFFEDLERDPRFGRDAIGEWWFEVWNEPNEGRFWSGTVEEYFDLYRATSEVVSELDLRIRLGGPAIAYKPQEDPAYGAPWMDRFFRFIEADPALKLDFVSLHRKGTVAADPPDPRRLYDAAVTTADQMLAIDPDRFGGIPVINNEADEKVGFEVPYAPRMHEAGAAWLCSVAAIHAGLNREYNDHGLRFIGAADNANLQLVEEPFDGRRSIMTLAGEADTDLVKVPAYAFYELLPLFGDRLGMVVSGADQLFPETDLYQLVTVSGTGIACMLTHYPDPEGGSSDHVVDIAIEGIPWSRVNVARFQIDRDLTNAYRAAGGSDANPYPSPDPDMLDEIRQAQELAVVRPLERGIELPEGTYREQFDLEPYTTICQWITPVDDAAPAAPEWVSIEQQGSDVILQWTPNREPSFYSYEVYLMQDGEPAIRLTPDPMRAALWIDTAPSSGRRVYGVRSVSASGVESQIVISRELVVVR